MNISSKEEIIKNLTKKENKKALWDFEFPQKICGRKATLRGLGQQAIAIRLESSKKFPHLDIKCFLSYDKFDKWTKEEKELVELLLNQL